MTLRIFKLHLVWNKIVKRLLYFTCKIYSRKMLFKSLFHIVNVWSGEIFFGNFPNSSAFYLMWKEIHRFQAEESNWTNISAFHFVHCCFAEFGVTKKYKKYIFCVVWLKMVHTAEDGENNAERRMKENLQRFLSQQQQQQQQQHQRQQQQQQQHGLRLEYILPSAPNSRTRFRMGSVTGRSVSFKCNFLNLFGVVRFITNQLKKLYKSGHI